MCNGNIRKRREKEEIFETIMTENFPKLTSETKPQTPEAQKTPNRINAKKKKAKTKTTIHLHIIFKLQKVKDKENILKEARGKRHLTYIEEQR